MDMGDRRRQGGERGRGMGSRADIEGAPSRNEAWAAGSPDELPVFAV